MLKITKLLSEKLSGYVSLLHGVRSLHQWRRGLPCLVERLRRWGAQAAPVRDASSLVVVIPGHRPAAQDVLKGPKDGAWGASGEIQSKSLEREQQMPKRTHLKL